MFNTNYPNISAQYEKSLEKEYKKKNGVFYTDLQLAIDIIKFLKISKNASIFDPCCGTGSFLLSAKELGYSNVYGADIDKKAISIARKETLLKNIKLLDTLATSGNDILKKFNLKEKLDYVIGNPPYAPISKNIMIDTADYLFLRNVKDSGSNLFIAALYRAFELVKPSGIISYIIPKNFLHVSSYGPLRRMILSEKTIISIVDIGPYFKNVRGEQIILTLQNQHTEKNEVTFYQYIDNVFKKKLSVRQDYYKDEILIFENNSAFNIYKNLESTYKKFSDVCKGYVGRGKSKSNTAVVGKDIRKFSFKDREVPNKGNKVFIQNIYSAESGIIATFAGDLEASETVTVFTDGDEKMCRYILGILHSRLCNYYLLNFCFNNSKLTMHTDARYLKKLPLVVCDSTFDKVISIVKSLEKIEYMSNAWFDMVESLNELIYQTYGIGIEEKNYIENKMKNLQSQRWNNDKQ